MYLNLVLEYVPDTVYRINKHYTKNEQRMPIILVKLYTYQMLRALAHIHSVGVCHRCVAGCCCAWLAGLACHFAAALDMQCNMQRCHADPPRSPTPAPCRRDIKPQNLLVNINTHALKLCDFGSAKTLVRGEPNISYICSRYYRAPELIFGATDYTCAIDVRLLACLHVC